MNSPISPRVLRRLRLTLVGLGIVVMVATSHGQTPGTSWTLRNPQPSDAYLYASAWTGTQMVVVGFGGTVLTSPDGIAWTPRSSGTTATLRAIVKGGRQLCTVGDAGTILTSPDGVTWTRRTSGTSLELRGVAWTGTRFSLVGEAGLAMTSEDGITWSTRFTGTSSDINAVVSTTGTQLAAVGDLGITLTSSTGFSWSQQSLTPAITFTSLAWTGSQRIGVTANGLIFTSPSGVAWTQRFASGTESFTGVTWSPSLGLAVAVGSGGTIVTSPDGVTWTPRTSGLTSFLLGVSDLGGQLLAVGAGGALLTSSDGITWVSRSTVSSVALRDVSWNGTKLVAVGVGGAVLTSPSGVSWTVGSSGVVEDLEAITWAGNQLVAVGAAGRILTSPDGISWTPRTSGTAQHLYGVVWTRSKLVAVGAGGTVVTSSDGILWAAPVTAPAATDLRSVAWTGSLLVAVGAGGAVATSATGAVWASSLLAPFADLFEVSWSGSQLVAVGEGDTILTSPNGVSWTQRSASFSENLLSVASNGTGLVTVGTSQTVATSATGAAWTRVTTSSPQLATLRSVGWFGTQYVAVGDGGTILTSGTPSPPTPVVSFGVASSTVPESAAPVLLTVSLSFAPLTTVMIPFTTSGTATRSATSAAGDYTTTVTPLIFSPGQLTRTLTINISHDALVEPTETLTITLGDTATALIGGINSFSLNITDDDIAPAILTDPDSQIAELGDPVSLEAVSSGSAPLTFQWRRNGKNLSGAVDDSYDIVSVGFGHAGRYDMIARNPTATAFTAPAELAVVDTTVRTMQVPNGRTAVISVSASGNDLSFQWQKDSIDIFDDTHFVGTNTRTLTIRNASNFDTANYTCEVTAPGGTLTGGETDLTILLPPVVTPPVFPSTMVSGAYSYALAASNFPTRFEVSGLPSGLTWNPGSGLVTGRPVASGLFSVRVSASNAAGASLVRTATLVVQGLPFGTVGNFAGIVARETDVNAGLGGRFTLTTTSTGSYSGSLVLGTRRYPFASRLTTAFNTNPVSSIPIPGSAATLNFTLNPGANLLSGTITAGGPTAAVVGWRNVWNGIANPALTRVGYYSFSLDLATLDVGVSTIPQGTGFGTVEVKADGAVSAAGRLSTGESYSSATFIGPNGEFLLSQPTFRNAGSVHGSLVVNPDPGSAYTDASISGTLSWARVISSPPSTRAYPIAFGPITLSAFGKYLSSGRGQVIQGLPSTLTTAALSFSEAGITSSLINPNVTAFTYTSANKAILPLAGSFLNPGRTTLVIHPTTGAVSGSFRLVDSGITRKVAYAGVVVRPSSGPVKAVGHFLLPQLPLASNTSPILSGKVIINQ